MTHFKFLLCGYKCSLCGYSSDLKRNVAKHINSVISCGAGEKKIIEIISNVFCEYCNKTFATTQNLTKHQKNSCKNKIYIMNNKKDEEIRKLKLEIMKVKNAKLFASINDDQELTDTEEINITHFKEINYNQSVIITHVNEINYSDQSAITYIKEINCDNRQSVIITNVNEINCSDQSAITYVKEINNSNQFTIKKSKLTNT